MPNCILIGSGPGVSEAIARRFGEGGYHIGLIARTTEKLKKQVKRLSEEGINATWAVADAGDLTTLGAAIQQLVADMGMCDVLIYNAAVMRPESPLEIESKQLEQDFAVNLLGAHLAAKIVVPAMIDKGHGAILFTGGGLALEPFPEWTSLALGKAALRSLSISLYKELAPKGIHVSVLAICGIVEHGGPFDPNLIAHEYWRVATSPAGIEDREVIFQPNKTDPLYNDPKRIHSETTVLPSHAKRN